MDQIIYLIKYYLILFSYSVTVTERPIVVINVVIGMYKKQFVFDIISCICITFPICMTSLMILFKNK